MKHYEHAMDYFTHRMLARMSFVTMWVYIEQGRYEDAMQSQFNFLYYRDVADEMAEKMTGKQTDTVLKLIEVANGVTR